MTVFIWKKMVIIAACIAAAGSAGAEVRKTMEPANDRIATVNGVAIERADFDQEVLSVEKTVLAGGKPLTCGQVASIRSSVAESMIRREALYQGGRKAGIKPDQSAVDREIALLRQQFPNEVEYRNELTRRSMSEQSLRAHLERNSVLQQYVDKQFAAKAAVTDAEMTGYYEGHVDLFRQPVLSRVSHILIQVDAKADDAKKQEARRKAEQILKDLKKGRDFAAMAREQSDGPTRTSGGDLGYIRPGQLEPKLDEAVFRLKSGETSEIIETAYGFHIFKVSDRKQESIMAYDTVKEQIRQRMIQEKAAQEADQYAKKLRDQATVEIFLADETATARKQ